MPGAAATPRADAAAQALEALHYIPSLELEFAVARDAPGVFRLNVKETELLFRDSRAEPAMRRLLERRPASSRLADLARPPTADLSATSCARRCASPSRPGCWRSPRCPSIAPPVSPSGPNSGRWRRSTPRERDHTATLRHSAFQFAPLQRLLAPLIDGTRTPRRTRRRGRGAWPNGRADGRRPGDPVTDPAELRTRLATATDNALAGLLRNGLLVES